MGLQLLSICPGILLLLLIYPANADVTGTHSSGTCFCLEEDVVNIRYSNCALYKQALKNQCYVHNGVRNTNMCSGYDYYGINFHGVTRYVAGITIRWGNSWECSLTNYMSSTLNTCLDCICSKESGGGTSPGCGSVTDTCGGMSNCKMDVGTCSCGNYQIKHSYFNDCSKMWLPISSWHSCALNDNCARICIWNHARWYAKSCTGNHFSQLTCAQIAGLHQGGSSGCNVNYGTTGAYRTAVTSCCGCS